MDLAAEWRGRRWRKLLNLIDGLPRNSEFVHALANDDDLIELLGDMPEQEPVRRLADYSVEAELLSLIADRLAELTQTTVAMHRVRPREVKPVPRPETAWDRRQRRITLAKHRSLVARLLPPE